MISNLEYYKTFLYVANLSSFTKAAEHLFISQSAVSQTIKKLEAEVNCTLFERSSRGLMLTPEGESLLLHVRRALEELDRGENRLSNMNRLKTDTLRIGATQTTVHHFMPPKLREFKSQHPNVRINFINSTTAGLCDMLQNGQIDLAFLITPIPLQNQLHLTKLRDFQDIPVVSTEYGMDLSKTYRPSELTGFPLITVDPTNPARIVFDEWFLKDNAFLNPDYTVITTGMAVPLVVNNLGIGLIPVEFAEDEIQKGRIARIKTITLPEMRTLYLVTRPGVALSPIGEQFLSFFVKK